MKTKLTIEFDNATMAMDFASWLDGSGEQSYWMWMENIERKDKQRLTAVVFNYYDHKFLGDITIGTVSGRLDEDE